jgi:hypothetical protein
MKKTAMIVMFLGVFIMLVGLPSAFAGPATNVRYDSGWLPWESGPRYNRCTDEEMFIPGIYRHQSVETQDGAGGYHFANQQIIRGTAVGENTGYGYKLKEVWSLTIPQAGEASFPFHSMAGFFRWTKTCPMCARVNIISTFDANGTQLDIFIFESLIYSKWGIRFDLLRRQLRLNY